MSVRASSSMASDEAGDPADPLYTRFKAWRSVIGNLLEYFEQLESMYKSQAKEFTKLSKTLEVPFKAPEFAPDGIAMIWQAMRDKATQLATFYSEEANMMKEGVIKELSKLKADLKKHLSDLNKEGVQGSKKVNKRMDKFSDMSQSLGKWIPVAETNPTALDADHDPYVLWRHIRHRLFRAVDEENVLNEQLLALQKRCQHYETLLVQAIQKALKGNADQVSKECQYSLNIANELSAIALRVPPGKEWEAFMKRELSLLPPDHKPRDPATVPFPFSDHSMTKPVIEGTFARKSTLLKRRQTSYYVLSAAGFLLEYKDSDPILNPEPNLSLKLTDCDLGNSPSRSGTAGFTIRGKDAGKSIGGRTHEYVFRTDSMEQATQWWTCLEKFIGRAPRTDAPTAGPTNDVSEGEKSPVPSQSSPPASPERTPQTEKQPMMPPTAEPGEQQPKAPAATTPASATATTAAAEPSPAPTPIQHPISASHIGVTTTDATPVVTAAPTDASPTSPPQVATYAPIPPPQ